MKKVKSLFVNSFFYYLAIELVEASLEELLVFGFSTLCLKIFSTFLVVFTTQTGKAFIRAIFKKLIYREGNDKVMKFKQFFTWLYCNKKTIGGYITSFVSSLIATLGGTGVIDVSHLIPIYICGFNITPILFYGALLICTILGIDGKGIETSAQFFARKDIEKEEKQTKKIEKLANKELANEEKKAKKVLKEQEKLEAKKQEEEKIKAEKEKLEEEKRARIEQAKAKILEEQSKQA